MLPDPRPYFADIADPRRETQNKLHSLHDIFMIVLCAVLSGADDWVSIETFAEERLDWLRQFIPLKNGVPSHDTLSNVMGRIDYKQFSSAFIDWMHAAVPSLQQEQLAIDGKTLRGSREQGRSTVHLVSAFATQARLVLAQQAVSEKSNEITAIPDLLSLLDLKGSVVSIDAMGCQKEIAAQIIEQQADYVLALKGNHPTLAEEVKLWLDCEYDAGRLERQETTDKGHGRLEQRRYAISTQLDWLSAKAEWSGLAAVGMVESVRQIKDKVSVDRRYYLCSISDLSQFSSVVRNHWSIENQQHWLLDVQFAEDANRSRKDHSAKNLAVVRRMVLNLLRRNDPHSKLSLSKRRLKAALNDQYRLKLILGEQKT